MLNLKMIKPSILSLRVLAGQHKQEQVRRLPRLQIPARQKNTKSRDRTPVRGFFFDLILYPNLSTWPWFRTAWKS